LKRSECRLRGIVEEGIAAHTDFPLRSGQQISSHTALRQPHECNRALHNRCVRLRAGRWHRTILSNITVIISLSGQLGLLITTEIERLGFHN